MSATLLIRHGRLVDPANGVDAPLDVLVRDGAVARVGKSLKPPEGAEIVDATGLVVCSGMIYVLHNAPSQPPRQWQGFPAFGVDDPIVAVRGPSWCRLVHRGVNWGYA